MEIIHSDCEFPLDQLPVLVIENIARYLSNKDVAACCAVSRGMRGAFDDELVWKPRYDSDRVKYLLQTPCKVQPGFIRPESNNSSISPVSEWRLAFMAENHLWNNWRQGNFKIEKFKVGIKQSLAYRHSLFYHEFISNDYVIAAFQGRIEILDCKFYPATLAVGPIQTPKYFHHIVKRNDFILLVCDTAVQVIQLNFCTKQWHVKHTFIVDESDTCSSKKIDKVHNFRDIIRPTIIFVAVQPYFVGCLKGDSTMHIWNFKTGVKLKKEKCPIENVTIQAIKSSYLNLVMAVKQQESNSSLFLVYDLSQTVFLPFSTTVQGTYEYSVLRNCVSIWADRILNIYNYQNCKNILSNYFLETYKLKPFRNNIVFLQEGVLKLFNQTTGVIETLCCEVVWFEVLSNKFIQLEVYPHPKYHIYGVCEVDSSRKLRRTSLSLDFKFCGYYLNKFATRYIVWHSGYYVLHFW